MVWRLKNTWVLVLASWLLGACLGGQTGEATSDKCSADATPWRVSVNGVSPEQLALAYQGEHRVNLHWSKDPIAISEAATLTLGSREQSGAKTCYGWLSVPVTFSVQADNGTIIDAGQGSLRADPGTPQLATFSGNGLHFLIAGNFRQDAGKVIVSGTLDPLVDPAAADSADFSSDSGGFAGAGGN